VARNAQTRPRIAPPCNRVARHPLAWSDERRQDGSRSLSAMPRLVFGDWTSAALACENGADGHRSLPRFTAKWRPAPTERVDRRVRVTLLSAPSSTCGHFLMARSSSACVCCAAASSLVWVAHERPPMKPAPAYLPLWQRNAGSPVISVCLPRAGEKGGSTPAGPGGLVTPSLKTATKTLS
jgi:hypothetical protein